MVRTVQTAVKLKAFWRPMTPWGRLTGSRASHFVRREFDLVPGVLFGGGAPDKFPAVPIATRGKDIAREIGIRGSSLETSLYRLQLEDGSEQVAIPRQVGVHPIKQYPISCNFVRYIPEKGANVMMPFKFTGMESCPGIKRGGMFHCNTAYVWCHVKGDHVPTNIPVSLDHLEVGGKVWWDELDLPENVKIIKRRKTEKRVLVCNITAKPSLIRAVRIEKREREAQLAQAIQDAEDDLAEKLDAERAAASEKA